MLNMLRSMNRPQISNIICNGCNRELSSLDQFKVDRKMISNLQTLVYTCYHCLMSSQSQRSGRLVGRVINEPRELSEFNREKERDLKRIEELQLKNLEMIELRTKDLEKKEIEFRQKITKHTETLHRLRAENDSILDEITRMRAERNKQRDILSAITIELSSINKSIEESEDKKEEKDHVCAICLDKERDHVLVECGHTMCAGCSAVISATNRCPTCQSEITKVIKFYIS